MRQYRGIRKDNGEWVYGGFYEIQGISFIIDINNIVVNSENGYPPVCDVVEVDPATVGQKICTFNKKDFYEGDKVSDNKGRTGYIRYRTDPISMEYEIKALTGGAWYDHMGPLWSFDNIEIIGNIHSEVQNES